MAETKNVDPYAKYRVNPNAKTTKNVSQEDPYAKYRTNPRDTTPEDSFDFGSQEDTNWDFNSETPAPTREQVASSDPNQDQINNDLGLQGKSDPGAFSQIPPSEDTATDFTKPTYEPVRVYGRGYDAAAQSRNLALEEKAAKSYSPEEQRKLYSIGKSGEDLPTPSADMYSRLSPEAADRLRKAYETNPNTTKLAGFNVYNNTFVPRPAQDAITGETDISTPDLIGYGMIRGAEELAQSAASIFDSYWDASMGVVNTPKDSEVRKQKSLNLTEKVKDAIIEAPESTRTATKVIIGLSEAVPGLLLGSFLKGEQAVKTGTMAAGAVKEQVITEVSSTFAKTVKFLKDFTGAIAKGTGKAVSKNAPDALGVSLSTPGQAMTEDWWQKLPDDATEAQKVISQKFHMLTEALALSGILGAGASAYDGLKFPIAYFASTLSPLWSKEAMQNMLVKKITQNLGAEGPEAIKQLSTVLRDEAETVLQLPEVLGGGKQVIQNTTPMAVAKGAEAGKIPAGVSTLEKSMALAKGEKNNTSLPLTNTKATAFNRETYNTLGDISSGYGSVDSADLTAKKAQEIATQRFMQPKLREQGLEAEVQSAKENLVNDIKNNPIGGQISDVLQRYDNDINVNDIVIGTQKEMESKIRNTLVKISDDYNKKYNEIASLPSISDEVSMTSFLDQELPSGAKLGSVLPKNIAEIVIQPDLPYGRLVKEVIPKVSERISDLLSDPKGINQEELTALMGLRKEIYETQLESMVKSGDMTKAQKKLVIETLSGYKRDIVPLSDTRSNVGKAFLTAKRSAKTSASQTAIEVANTEALNVAKNVDVKKPLDRVNIEYLKGQPQETKDVVTSYHILNKVLDIAKSGNGVKDLPSVIDEKFLKSNFGDLATSLGEFSPKTVKDLNDLLSKVKSGKATIDDLNERLVIAKKETSEIQKQVNNSALVKYFFEKPDATGQKVSDGYKALKGLIENENVDEVRSIIEAIKTNGDDNAMDGLKGAYARYLKEGMYEAGSGGKKGNSTEIARLFDKEQGSQQKKISKEIFKDDPSTKEYFDAVTKELAQRQRFTADSTVTSNSSVTGTSAINELKDVSKIGSNILFGPLDPKGTALNAGIRLLIKTKGMKQMMDNMLDNFQANPRELADGIDFLMKSYKDPTYYQKAGGNERLIKVLTQVYSLTPSDEEVLRKRAEKPKPKVPQAVEGASSIVKPEDIVQAGNINILKRPQVKNSDGSISTVRSISFENNKGQTVVIPTVIVDDKHPKGYVASNEEALKHYNETGEHLGIFKSRSAAEKFAKNLHKQQSKYYNIK